MSLLWQAVLTMQEAIQEIAATEFRHIVYGGDEAFSDDSQELQLMIGALEVNAYH